MSSHTTVLLNETIDGLNLKAGAVVVDMTLNDGGHTEEVFRRMSDSVKVIGIDADQSAIDRAKLRLSKYSASFITEVSNFRNIDEVLLKHNIKSIDGVIMDLGLSSNQLEDSKRGFSFKTNDPLLMTFSEKPLDDELTAFEIVNTWAEENLEAIIKYYGEESFARKIAHGIVEARKLKSIEKSDELAEVIKCSVPFFYRKGKTHPATKTFQAIRITVNDEIKALEEGLEKSFNALAKEGRMSVISFHSIEDRIVKVFMKKKASEEKAILITKKVIVPKREEILSNPRSRSSKLRILEKI